MGNHYREEACEEHSPSVAIVAGETIIGWLCHCGARIPVKTPSPGAPDEPSENFDVTVGGH